MRKKYLKGLFFLYCYFIWTNIYSVYIPQRLKDSPYLNAHQDKIAQITNILRCSEAIENMTGQYNLNKSHSKRLIYELWMTTLRSLSKFMGRKKINKKGCDAMN